MFVMYFIHKIRQILTNMFRPKHVFKIFVNKIHNKHRMHFVGYLYVMDLIND